MLVFVIPFDGPLGELFHFAESKAQTLVQCLVNETICIRGSDRREICGLRPCLGGR